MPEPPGARALGGSSPGGFFTFSCIFAGLGLCFQLRPSFFQGFVLLFLSVYYRRPAGVGGDPEKKIFRAESTPSDSWTFSFVFITWEANPRADAKTGIFQTL